MIPKHYQCPEQNVPESDLFDFHTPPPVRVFDFHTAAPSSRGNPADEKRPAGRA
jgi:hypothetical protein